eukprot:CAMPEP_0170143452 /NCGR_PEP_ID=MMETSP0033_2-20121228/11000_1 /TAXON_ID=195969 /ORGANISM="Dolichomastix tenuilepis, Strain CCMP3274" /LENGTH=380 /DNA_ID=CAMNT_0010379899 /DNA_START=96 /DNA_END=1238 /DNA_ORIENTATION=+
MSAGVGRACGASAESSSWRPAVLAAASKRSAAVAAVDSVPDCRDDIDWDNLGFGLTATNSMWVSKCGSGEEWGTGGLEPFGDITMSPSAAVLNYGQGIFEGMKACRTEKGHIAIFRPEANAGRFADGAVRMSMPPVPTEQFVEAVKAVVAANAEFVPPQGKGALYLRPLLIGTGAVLGLQPATEYTFLVYCSPVGAYFPGGQLTPINLVIEESFHRAAPGGTGGTKCIGNYSPVLLTQRSAKEEGFADVMYLDAAENKYVEEVSSCNVFAVFGRTIRTPELGGTILPGITRRSIIELAKSRGYEVEEGKLSADELLQADEVFTTGTAVVVSPVGSITMRGEKTLYKNGEVGPVALELYEALTNLQSQKSEDPFGWVTEVL